LLSFFELRSDEEFVDDESEDDDDEEEDAEVVSFSFSFSFGLCDPLLAPPRLSVL
jgi:hypothetical protein